MVFKTHLDLPQHYLSCSPFNGRYTFTEFREQDVAAILSIETAINPSPWSEENFRSSLARKHLCLGVKQDQDWIAYAVCSQVLDEVELFIIGVSKEQQGKGLGKVLLSALIEMLRVSARTLFLEVRESNQRAISLYESVGFNCVGQRPNYYPPAGKNPGREDAYIFALELIE